MINPEQSRKILEQGDQVIKSIEDSEKKLRHELELRKNGHCVTITNKLVPKVLDDQIRLGQALEKACITPDTYFENNVAKKAFFSALDKLMCDGCKEKVYVSKDGAAALECIKEHIKEHISSKDQS